MYERLVSSLFELQPLFDPPSLYCVIQVLRPSLYHFGSADDRYSQNPRLDSLTLERIDAAKADHIANRDERNAQALEKAQKKLTQRRT